MKKTTTDGRLSARRRALADVVAEAERQFGHLHQVARLDGTVELRAGDRTVADVVWVSGSARGVQWPQLRVRR